MAIEVKEIVRRYRYNGVTLPDVAGMSPKEIRDLYSAQYPELVSAEIDTGEIVDLRAGDHVQTGRGHERLTCDFPHSRHGSKRWRRVRSDRPTHHSCGP